MTTPVIIRNLTNRLTKLGALGEMVYSPADEYSPYVYYLNVGEEKHNPIVLLAGTGSEKGTYQFTTPVANGTPRSQSIKARKAVGYINRLIKYGLRIERKAEKLGVTLPSPVGQYLFHFTPEEAEQLIFNGVRADKAVYLRYNHRIADLEQIIGWKDLPREWVDLLVEHV